MRAVIQRVSQASVSVEGRVAGEIGPGLLTLLGVAPQDTPRDAAWLADKITGLRVFEDETGRMNLSLADMGGAMLIVSQFTLLADCGKGRRPSFTRAAAPGLAEELYQEFSRRVELNGISTARGIFGAHMRVALVNDGPVTMLLDTAGEF